MADDRITLRIPPAQRRVWEREARQRRVSLGEFVRSMVSAGLWHTDRHRRYLDNRGDAGGGMNCALCLRPWGAGHICPAEAS